MSHLPFKPPFPGGSAPLDRLPVWALPGEDPVALAARWHNWAASRGARSWPSAWGVDSDVFLFFHYLFSGLPETSGVPWVITSDFRASPSHADGGAVDIAPRPRDWSKYSLARGVDPILNARTAVKRHLDAAMIGAPPLTSRSVTAYVEDDHVHVHFSDPGSPPRSVLWPKRTHHHYISCPVDEQLRSRPPQVWKPRL